MPANSWMSSSRIVRSTGSRATGRSRSPNRSVCAGAVGSMTAPARREADLAAQRVRPQRRERPAAAHEPAQPAAQRGRQPARVARQEHSLVAREPRAAAGRQRHVRGDVVAPPRAVEEAEDRRLRRSEAGGQAVPAEDPDQPHRDAAVELVGQAVPVVVELVAALPGHERQDHEHAARRVLRARVRARRLHGEGHAHLMAGRPHGEQVRARLPARRVDAQPRARPEAAPDRVAGPAHPPQAPAVAAPAGVHEELRELAGAHRLDRRRHPEIAHGDPRAVVQLDAVAAHG